MIVAGTGHRPDKLGGYSREAYHKLVHLAIDWIIENKPELVISGMALGWDQALALASYKCGVPFVAAIPFKGQESAWPADSQRAYFDLLGKADVVVIVSEGGYSASKMQIRNEYMVNKADVILTIYDGTKGGTRNCLIYAQKQSKPYVNLYEKWSK